MRPTTASTEQVLLSLSVGERAWFWFCPELAERDTPSLLLQPFTAAPDRLLAQAGDLGTPPGARECMGVASVDEDGSLRLGSATSSPEALAALSRWVHHNISKHPGLARMRGARMVQISAAGLVEAVHHDEALWAGLPVVASPGSLESAAEAIAALPVGASLWFWLLRRGPSGRPFLAVRSAEEPPAAFVAQVEQVQRRCVRSDRAAQGTIRRLDARTVAFLTSAPLDAVEAMLAKTPLPLDAAVLARLKGGEIVEHRLATLGADLSALSATLSGLAPGDSAWFLFSEEGLVVGDRETVKAAGRPEGAVRGKLRRHPEGWLELRTRAATTGLLAALIRWTAAGISRWPALARLNGARVIYQTADGVTHSRERDDDAWAQIGAAS